MTTHEQEPEETAVRVATLLSTVMNVAAILANAPLLQATDGAELRSTLLGIADEMEWVGTIAGSIAGLSWPSDAQDRIDLLRAVTGAWNPASPPPPDMLDVARACVGLFQPGSARP
jgi:hypothetical protein